jgi:hypothetical protein
MHTMEWVAHIMTALGPATMTLDDAPCALKKEVQHASKANGGRGAISSKDGSDRASDGGIRRRAVLEQVSEDPRGTAVALLHRVSRC